MFDIIYTLAEWGLNNKNAATKGGRQRLTSKIVITILNMINY